MLRASSSAGFNPLIGILFLHAWSALSEFAIGGTFQSPNRDSVSSRADTASSPLKDKCFNPLIGILFLHAG